MASLDVSLRSPRLSTRIALLKTRDSRDGRCDGYLSGPDHHLRVFRGARAGDGHAGVDVLFGDELARQPAAGAGAAADELDRRGGRASDGRGIAGWIGVAADSRGGAAAAGGDRAAGLHLPVSGELAALRED